MQRDKMKEKIERLYSFLENNRAYPVALLTKHREGSFAPFRSKADRIFALLHYTFYTQSQPKLDKAQRFFEALYQNRNRLNTFQGFCGYLGSEDFEKPYLSLYRSLERKEGWGEKTSALLVKNIYQLHHLPEMDELKLWDDVPKLHEGDWLHLPVDAVIKDIFKRFDPSLYSFKKINRYLRENDFPNSDTWDDLWYWGYFTQNAKDKSQKFRAIGFNKGKYWLDLYTPKEPKKIEEICAKCKKFTNLLPK